MCVCVCVCACLCCVDGNTAFFLLLFIMMHESAYIGIHCCVQCCELFIINIKIILLIHVNCNVYHLLNKSIYIYIHIINIS